MLNTLLNAAGAVGNVLDLPSSSVRDALAGRNPFDQWATPLTDSNRTSGRDLLRAYNLAGKKDTWGNFAGGMLAEAALDPLNVVPGMGLAKAARASDAAVAANRAIEAANATSMAQRAAGFLPEEVIPKLHKSVLDDAGRPKVFYHGSPDISFEKYDLSRDNGQNLYGKGIYASDSVRPTGHPDYGYWKKGLDGLKKYELPEENVPAFRAAMARKINDDVRDALYKYREVRNRIKEGRGIDEDLDELARKHSYLHTLFNGRHGYVEDAVDTARDLSSSPLTIDEMLFPDDARSLIREFTPPAGVKKHFVDLRNPLDIDAINTVRSDKPLAVNRYKVRDLIRDVKVNSHILDSARESLLFSKSHAKRYRDKLRLQQEKLRSLPEDEINRRNVRKLIRDIIDSKTGLEISKESVQRELSDPMRAIAQERIKQGKAELRDAFASRNKTTAEIPGEEYWASMNSAHGTGANDVLKSQGYDGIVHIGGRNFRAPPGVDPHHQVAIAFSPEQMHLPYIAPAIKPLQPVPSVTPAMMKMAMYNAAARLMNKKNSK